MKRVIAASASAVLFSSLPLAFGGCSSTGVGNPPDQCPLDAGQYSCLSTDEEALVDDGDDGTKASDNASSLIAVPLLALKKPEHLATANIAAAVGEYGKSFFTAGCVTTTRAANVVTFDFAGCNGVLGLVGVQGTLTATYVAGPVANSIDVTVKSSDPFTVLRLNKKLELVSTQISVDATAHYELDGDVQKLHWNGTYGASTDKGAITQSAEYDASFDTLTNCVSLGGSATTTFAKYALDTAVSGYHRCGDRKTCPDAGGAVTYTRKSDGAFLRVEFLGGRSAKVSTANKSVVIDDLLKCSG